MSVNLSPVAGAAAQFLDNNGNVLTGGKLFTYLAGTTTPAATYTSSAGAIFHSNPIILDAAGRVQSGGEIWLSDNIQYKFVLKDANDVLIATWDNLSGINSNFVNYTVQEEVQTATAGQTVFNLSTITYAPGTNSLSVYVDGVNQYEGSTYSFVETNATTVTFTAGLHVGALVKFTTAVSTTGNATNASVVVYNPAGTGAVATNVQVKLRETVSVKDFGAVGDGVADDTAEVQAAVTYCYTNDVELLWPTGTYLTSSSINNFHEVLHIGTGIVKRSTDTFYPSPNTTSVNKIYCSPLGLATNDGLSASQPILAIQTAIDILPNYGPVLSGTWQIILAAGTYARGRFPDEGLQSENPIEISGPDVSGHPNVPTAIISEGANGISAEGIKIAQNTQVKCSNLLFIGFNGTSSAGGFTSGGYCKMYSVNCHFTNCTWGISCGQHSFLDVKGGIFDGCGFDASGVAYSSGGGIRGIFLTKFSVGTQNAGTLAGGPILRNNNFGVFAQEHIDGHVDWSTFEDNNHHVRLNFFSRLNLSGSSFKRASGAAVWAAESSNISLSTDTVFGTGADANYINTISNTGSVVNPSTVTNNVAGFAISQRCIYRSILNQVVNTTSNTVVYQIPLKAQLWRDGVSSVSGMKKIGFKMYGTLSGTTGFKRAQMRFGATQTNVNFISSDTGAFECEGYVLIGTNPIGTQSTFISGKLNNATTKIVIGTTSEAMTSDTNFNVEALVQNTADSITVTALEVYVDGL